MKAENPILLSIECIIKEYCVDFCLNKKTLTSNKSKPKFALLKISDHIVFYRDKRRFHNF